MDMSTMSSSAESAGSMPLSIVVLMGRVRVPVAVSADIAEAATGYR
jgi:hypothetical protein